MLFSKKPKRLCGIPWTVDRLYSYSFDFIDRDVVNEPNTLIFKNK